jgi:uncharacterized DUF497 family protein
MGVPRWTWDPSKAAENRRKHKVSFELAERVLDDPWQASRLDSHAFEERWQTIGRPSTESPPVLIVIHTAPRMQEDGEEEGRISSARKAEPSERRAYAEGKFQALDPGTGR